MSNNVTTVFELLPTKGQKSFYGKALVYRYEDGTETLYSYDTAIIDRLPNGDLIPRWYDWTVTTGKHIAAFCGLNKKDYFRIMEETPAPTARYWDYEPLTTEERGDYIRAARRLPAYA